MYNSLSMCQSKGGSLARIRCLLLINNLSQLHKAKKIKSQKSGIFYYLIVIFYCLNIIHISRILVDFYLNKFLKYVTTGTQCMWYVATVAQWIRHLPPRPIYNKIHLHESEPGIAGSSPIGGCWHFSLLSLCVVIICTHMNKKFVRVLLIYSQGSVQYQSKICRPTNSTTHY